MNPFQKQPRKITSSIVAQSHLLRLMEIVELDLEKYKLSDKPNKYAISKQENLLTLIHNFIDSVEREQNLNIEVIKKQALIIESAGVKYPTIFQSLGHIQQIYQQAKGLPLTDSVNHIEISVI